MLIQNNERGKRSQTEKYNAKKEIKLIVAIISIRRKLCKLIFKLEMEKQFFFAVLSIATELPCD